MSTKNEIELVEASTIAKKNVAQHKKNLRAVFSHIPHENLVKNTELSSKKGYTPLIIQTNWNGFHYRYWDYGDNKEMWLVYIESTTQEKKTIYGFWFRKENCDNIMVTRKTLANYPDLPIKELLDLSGYRRNWFVVDNNYLEEATKKKEELFRPKSEDPKKEKSKKAKEESKKLFAKEPKKEMIVTNGNEMKTEQVKIIEDPIIEGTFIDEPDLEEEKDMSNMDQENQNLEEEDLEQETSGLELYKPPTQSILRLEMPVDKIVEIWKEFRELDTKLLDDNDFAMIQGKKTKKKSAFRKYKLFYSLSDKIVKEKHEFLPDGSYYCEYHVSAFPADKPNYQSIGIGIVHSKEKCSDEDKEWTDYKTNKTKFIPKCEDSCNGMKHFNDKIHDIVATAHTRAKNRAISDLVAGGEVSYEEIV